MSNTYHGVSPTFQQFISLQTGSKQSSAIAIIHPPQAAFVVFKNRCYPGASCNTYRGVSPTFQQFPTLQTGPKQSSAIAVFIQRKLLSWFFAKASRLVSQFWTKAEVNSISFSVAVILLYFHDFFSRPQCISLYCVRAYFKSVLYVWSVFWLWNLKISNLNCQILLALCKIRKKSVVFADDVVKPETTITKSENKKKNAAKNEVVVDTFIIYRCIFKYR